MKSKNEELVVSVVIPCYNEVETLKNVLEKVRACGLKTHHRGG